MSAPITRAEWDAKLKQAHDQAQRATKAEFARNYNEAFELYVRSGQAFLWLINNLPSPAQDVGNSSSNAVLTVSGHGAATPRTAPGCSSSPTNHADSCSNSAQSREKIKQTALKVMARAEKIKALRKDLRPIERDVLSTESQSSILVASSLINGQRYPVWTGVPSQRANSTPSSASSPDSLPSLSPVQVRKGAHYKRASDVASPDAQGWGEKLRGSDIVQDIVADCSFVAALEVAAEHDHLFGGQLATSALYPQDAQGRNQPSSGGQYHIKLHINGTPRIVSVDDNLPYYSAQEPSSEQEDSARDTLSTAQGRLMCATSRTGQAIWPALLEKAYLQIMGGYDFAGSNGSIDLYALTGWLPEHIFLRHAGFQREKTWNRFFSAWTAGRCMATAGTGKVPSHQQSATIELESGLVSSHNYAILDVLECGSRRYVKLMNPWRTAAGIRPAIAISPAEEERIYREVSLESRFQQVNLAEKSVTEEATDVSPTFTITWDDLCSHFDSLFLNWDPKLFDNNVTVHSCWTGADATPSSTGLSAGFKQPDPHFRLSVTVRPSTLSTSGATKDPSEEVWLLLTRHITSTSISAKTAEDASSAEFIALHVFEDDLPVLEGAQSTSAAITALPLRKAKHMGAYVDGTHCLVRLKPPFLQYRAPPPSGQLSATQKKKQCNFTVVVSRRNERDENASTRSSTARDVNYTLSVFSRYHMELSELRTRLAFCEAVSGSWTARTAGGNAMHASFMSNPQYALTIPSSEERVQVQVVLETTNRQIPVQVLLTYPGSGSGRVTHLTEGDVVLSSGMYHHGFALCSTAGAGAAGLKAGVYTLIASTFEAGMQGDFHLRVESTSRVQLKPIPQEGAGMFHRRLAGAWQRGSSARGSRREASYLDNPSWRFTIDRPGLSGFIARIRTEADATGIRPYVNLVLFCETDPGLREVASSGTYTDLTCGAVIEHVKLPAATYRLVASTYQADTQAEFAIDLYTAAKINLIAL